MWINIGVRRQKQGGESERTCSCEAPLSLGSRKKKSTAAWLQFANLAGGTRRINRDGRILFGLVTVALIKEKRKKPSKGLDLSLNVPND